MFHHLCLSCHLQVYLLLIFFLRRQPGLYALPGLHESQPLSNLARVVSENSGHVCHHEQHEVGMQLQLFKTILLNQLMTENPFKTI